jgi:hypothetical protein
MIKKVYQPSYNKRRRNISHSDDDEDHQDKAKTGVTSGCAIGVIPDGGREQDIQDIRQDPIHEIEEGYHRPAGNDDGRQDDETLEKVL